ncbi:MAG: hypothetical protein JKY56_21520 [Kofleriaceae bacterium]|nr:hypothetical protein [Kofleriaceae bacterium]
MRLPPILALSFVSAFVSALGLASLFVAPGCTKSQSASPKHTGDKVTSKDAKSSADKSQATPSAVGFLKAKPQACMYHQEAQGYFRCLSGADGQCFHFGESCAPKNLCMFDMSKGVARTCESAVNGQCFSPGDACEKKKSCQYSLTDRRYHICEQSSEGKCKRIGALCLPTE